MKDSYNNWKSFFWGRNDGRKNYPPAEADFPSQYERELLDVADKERHELAIEWKKMEEKLEADHHKAHGRKEAADKDVLKAEGNYERAEAEYNSAKMGLEDLEHVLLGGFYLALFRFCLR
jgi:hypothetical protein